ncbi:MAG: SocA family protein, partial [bacterium]|nr:SocA family protein [bacterium]
VYFADRYHLRKYGQLITNDEYYAMKLGPVASGVKDLLYVNTRMLSMEEQEYTSRFFKESDQYHVEAVRDFEPKALTQTDIEALDFAWEKFGHYDEFTLSKRISHQYPDWKKHEQKLNAPNVSRVLMSIEDFLEDSDDPSVEPCYALSTADKADTLEELREMAYIEALWT